MEKDFTLPSPFSAPIEITYLLELLNIFSLTSINLTNMSRTFLAHRNKACRTAFPKIPIRPNLINLPPDVLRKIMMFTMGTEDASTNEEDEEETKEVFLNASDPTALQNGISLAYTCKVMLSVFQESLTGVKLVSSWQREQKTLIAACKIAAKNLRAIHVECSAPVTAALREVVSLRPPIRHFVLIGINISKVLMADIISFVGASLEKLVISAAPSLDCSVVNLIADCCRILKFIELGGSRRVGSGSLIKFLQKVGPSLQGIEFNSLQHESLGDEVLFEAAEHCHRLSYVRFLKLKWVTDAGLERLFTIRASQLTELRLISCRRATARALCILSEHGSGLEKIRFSFDKGESLPMQRQSPQYSSLENGLDNIRHENSELCLSKGEIAMVHILRKSRNLRYFSLTDASISDIAMVRMAKACGNSLRVLNIRQCTSLGNDTIRALAKYTHNLHSLDISYLTKISDQGLRDLLIGIKESLRELQIIGCTKLTDNAIRYILPRHGKKLRIIRLSYCNFSPAAVNSLKDGLPRVTLCGASKCSVQ